MGKKQARRLRIPSYRKHRSGQARVTISGRDYYLGPYDSEESKTAYQRLISEYLATSGAMQPTASHDELTIAEMLDQFVAYATPYYGTHSSELDDLKRIMRRLKKSYADLPAAQFVFVQFEAIRTEMIKEGSSRGYVNEQMRRCVRIFRWAASRSLISPSVAQTLGMIGGLRRGRTTAPEPKKILPVDRDTVIATIKHLPSVVADMVRLHQCLGCRPCELCRWSIDRATSGKSALSSIRKRISERSGPFTLVPVDKLFSCDTCYVPNVNTVSVQLRTNAAKKQQAIASSSTKQTSLAGELATITTRTLTPGRSDKHAT